MGERAKFGLSVPDLLATVEALRQADLLGELRLLHFHVGSQINDIAVLKDALQEAGQIYVQLAELGAPMGYLDVGGGLGIDYDGSRTATAASTNYSLQNYANDVVATVRECCEPRGMPVPTLVSESGRAIVSHFSVLVFDVLGTAGVPGEVPPGQEDEPLIVRNLRDTLAGDPGCCAGHARQRLHHLQESAGLTPSSSATTPSPPSGSATSASPERAMAEQLTGPAAEAIAGAAGAGQRSPIPDDLRALQAALAGTYYANLSVFRSAPDTWAIDQLFPVMPIHRLDERPDRPGQLR